MSARAVKTAPVVQKHSWARSNWLPISIGLLVCGALVYLLERTPPMSISDPIVAGTPTPGRTVSVDWIQNWKKLCPGTVTRTVEGAHGEIQAIRPFEIYPPAVVGVRHQVSTVYIPKNIGAGPATLRSTIRFRCNALQEFWPIIVRAPPVEIIVKEGAPPALPPT